MGSRLLILLLISLLALPMTAVLPPVQASPQVQEPATLTLAAKKKDKKGKPKFKTITKTVRQSVTQTFTSAGGITIPDNGDATPYPSTIAVAGFTNGVITDVNLILNQFSHTHPDDVDMLLAPAHLSGQNAIVMGDVGDAPDAMNLALTLDDQAAAPLPDATALVSGTFRPTNALGADGADAFPTQTPSGNTLLSVFNAANPNGTWQLFVVDDAGTDSGSIASWALQITAEADVQVEKKVKVKKDKKKGKRR